MQRKNFLVFDLWGDWAHFRKFYTTSSPQSYDFPTRTVLSGIIGAIVGLKKSSTPGINEEYTRFFGTDETSMAVHILKPIKKQRMNLNYIDTKRNWRGERGARTQVRSEFIKNPRYRIYFSTNHSEIYGSLKVRLENHRAHFTISLGLSELLANYEFVGEFVGLFGQDNSLIQVNNVVPYDSNHKIKITQGDLYNRDVLPNEMNEERVVTERKEFIFKTNWQDSPYLQLQSNHYYQLDNGENIIPM